LKKKISLPRRRLRAFIAIEMAAQMLSNPAAIEEEQS
jgi:hypothetical protein